MFNVGLIRPVSRTLSSNLTRRCFHHSPRVLGFKKRIEEDVRYLIDTLPPASRLYQNPDGTPREPSDLELHKIAQLSLLAEKRKLRLWEYFFLSEADSKLYADNYTDIQNLLPSSENGASGDIIDKVPFADDQGKIQWKIVRENETEGWEKLSYYGLVPGLILLIGIHLFKDEPDIDQWAEHELKLRALEDGATTEEAEELLKDAGKTPQQIKDRDNLIIERILSGEYDKLAGLQLKKFPVSLVGDISGDLPQGE